MTDDDRLVFTLRYPGPNDLQFIFSSWIRSMGDYPPFCDLDRNWFATAQHALIAQLLKRSRITVACDPGDHDQIFGYCIHEPRNKVLHWVYVKKNFRGQGVARNLIESTGAGKGSIRFKFATRLAEHFGLAIHTKWILEKQQ